MQPAPNAVFIVNCGSSSIKFALYETGQVQNLLLKGEIAGIGTANAIFRIYDHDTNQQSYSDIGEADQTRAGNYLIDWFEKEHSFSIKAIGHRIVHGVKHTEPELISETLLDELKTISAYDPNHLPAEISLIEAFRARYPQLQQVACFDTSFHADMPSIAKLLPIPRKYLSKGVQRYGFHGLSCTYLMEELNRLAGKDTAQGKVILAHLGSGASITAVKDGKSVDTSMGFTPAAGLPMSTRTGDLDPGLAWYLMQFEKMNAGQFNNLVNHKSGLLGISGTSGDMRLLLQDEKTDTRAAEAVEFFCYQTRKWIGSFATVLNGLDTLVFAGGIGEGSAAIRERICGNLHFLGVELDSVKNSCDESIISSDKSSVCVRVIKTNEELIIARLITRLLNNQIKQ